MCEEQTKECTPKQLAELANLKDSCLMLLQEIANWQGQDYAFGEVLEYLKAIDAVHGGDTLLFLESSLCEALDDPSPEWQERFGAPEEEM